MEEINKISKSSIIRTIVAWLMGILALLLIVNLLNQIEFIKTLTSSEDSPSMIIILIISAMISIRIGRAIYYGKLNGGVSPRGNKRFMYWIGIIIILGVLGEFVFMLLNAIVGKNIVLIVIVSIFVWVIAFELVRMFSAQISKFIKKWDIFKHKDYYKTLLKAGKYEEALKNIRFFVAKGDMEAEHNLGLMYANGYGVKQDNKEALKWYQKAADQGYDKAENIFGLMYMRGDGVRQDYKEALKWFAKSSEHDNGELSII